MVLVAQVLGMITQLAKVMHDFRRRVATVAQRVVAEEPGSKTMVACRLRGETPRLAIALAMVGPSILLSGRATRWLMRWCGVRHWNPSQCSGNTSKSNIDKPTPRQAW